MIADAVRRHAGDDYTLTVKITVEEEAPPFAPRTNFEDGLELCRLAESFGYHAITPVGLSIFPHASLCRGSDPIGHPRRRLDPSRFEAALGGSRLKMAVLALGLQTWSAPVSVQVRLEP